MLQATFGYLCYCLLRLLGWSYRFDCDGSRNIRPPETTPECLLAVWHQNLLAGILAQAGNPFVVMVSRSRDGNLIDDLCTRLGFTVFRGSSRSGSRDKGGSAAKHSMTALLNTQRLGALTVDGPRGPSKVVKPGIIDIARQSGLPIVPYYLHQSSYWSFNKSWDKFRFPKPFCKIEVVYGDPIYVPADVCNESFGEFQVKVADAINALEERCNRAHGTRH